MSDYETFQTFQKWAAEAVDMIANNGDDYLRTWCWQSPLKAAFMNAILLRRQLKREIDGIRGHGLAYQAMAAMNELDEAAYGYIDYDNYDDDYPTPGPASGDASYMSSDELRDSLRTLIEAPSRGLASVWPCEAQTAEPAPECTVSLGTEEDLRAWEVGDAITFKFEPSPDSGVAHQMVPVAGVASDWRERVQAAMEAAITRERMRCQLAQAIAEGVIPGSRNYSGNLTNLIAGKSFAQIIVDDVADDPGQPCAVTDSDDGQHQSPLDAIGEDVLNTVIAPVKQGQPTAKPQAHTDPYFSPAAQHDMEPVEVWCKPKTGKAYRHCVRPRKAAEELVERNNSQYRGIAEYWIEP